MVVELRPITVENWVDCVGLKPTEEQEKAHFVAPNAFSLTQASFEPWWESLGIYADDVMVGFVMHGRWPSTGLPSYYPAEEEIPVGVHYILRFMVDGRYQGKGYGKAAMVQLIERVRQCSDTLTLCLSYEPENFAAAALYTGVGFRPTGEMHGGEIEMKLEL
jgi:diamine N-acetyltransferase